MRQALQSLSLKVKENLPCIVVHAFDPSPQEADTDRCEFEASQPFTVRSDLFFFFFKFRIEMEIAVEDLQS